MDQHTDAWRSKRCSVAVKEAVHLCAGGQVGVDAGATEQVEH